MVCIVEFDNGLRFNFAQNKYKQRVWIEVLLKYSRANIAHIANILDLPIETLIQVQIGNQYLENEEAERLGQLFLITFYD